MKKFLSVLLILFVVATQAQIRIYFKRPTTWGTAVPRIHIFNTPYTNDTVWPGEMMSETCNPDWYFYTADSRASFVNFVINNGNSQGGNQTQDLTASSNVYYLYNTTTNTAFISPNNPMIPNPCVKINRDSGTWYTGTLVPVSISAMDYLNPTETPIIYYTKDGTVPTTNSPSATGNINFNYSSGKNVLQAMAISSYGNSQIEYRTYDFTTQGILVNLIIDNSSGNYTSWLINNPKIHFWGVQTSSGNATINDSNWPGVSMYPNGQTNQFQYFFPYATVANMVFNNGNGQQTPDVTNITSAINYYYPSNTVVLATQQQKILEKVEFYPNPTKDFITIYSSEKIAKIEIFDLQGKLVAQGLPIESKFNVANLISGTYLAKFSLGNGKVSTSKLIKK